MELKPRRDLSTPELIQKEIQRRISASTRSSDQHTDDPYVVASRQVFQELLEQIAERMKVLRTVA